MESDEVCRACLGARGEPTGHAKLFEPPPPGRLRLTDMLAQIAPIRVMENDGLPSVICLKCVRSTYNAFAFKRLCEESDAKLRNYLNVHGTNVAPIPIVIKNELREKGCDEYRIESFSRPSDGVHFDAMSDTEDLAYDAIESTVDTRPSSAISFNIKDEFERDTSIPDLVDKSVHDDSVEKRDAFKNFIIKEELLDGDLKNVDFHMANKKNSLKNNVEFGLPNDKVNNTHSCVECENRFPSYKELKRHVKMDHVKKKGTHVTCKICDQTFAYRQTLTRHMKIHQENTKNKLCTFCGKSFLRADDLKRHTRIHTGERPYSCDQCPKKYKQSSELKDHMKSHSSAKSYMCTECGKSLATRNGLYIHMKVHRGEKNRECKICGNKFVTNGELNSHINHIHSREKPFECLYDGCARAFTTKLSLKTHLRAHTGEKPYQCTVCGKSLATSSSLHEHKRIHTGEKPKKCNICERRLGNSQALKKHMRLHTGERPYQCTICFEKFICASTLSTHIKIKHMEKQHRCSICHKMFALGTKLRQHMRLHLDKKIFKCDLCEMSFSHKSKLYQHTKVHDNEKVIGDNVCTEENKQITLNTVPITQLNVSNMLLSHYM